MGKYDTVLWVPPEQPKEAGDHDNFGAVTNLEDIFEISRRPATGHEHMQEFSGQPQSHENKHVIFFHPIPWAP